MTRARSFAGILCTLAAVGFISGCAGASVGPPVDLAGEQDGDVEPDWNRAAAYLDSLFDPQQSLCREYPGANTFFTTPDNALVGRALSYLTTPTSPNPTHGAEIIARLQSLRDCACNDDPGHDGLSNHSIDPLVTKGAQIPLQPRSVCKGTPRLVPPPSTMCGDAGTSCLGGSAMVQSADHATFGWVAGYCQPGACATTAVVGWDAEGMGQGAADELALQILNRKNRGLDPMPQWQHLASKWDGQGLRDRAAMTEGKYSTASLALFKICARVLGQPLPGGVNRKLADAQNPQGGFRTAYDLNGQFSLDQLGNAATTAQVILAFRKPAADF